MFLGCSNRLITPDVGAFLVRGQRRVACHQEVEPRSGNQRRDQPDQVIVHVARVPQGCGGHGHDSGHQLVDLGKGGSRDKEPVRGNPVEGGVIQDHNTVRGLGEPLQGQDGVVRLYHHVRHHVVVALLVGEHAVGLHQLLGEPVCQLLQDVAPHAAASTASDRVSQHEALEAVAALRLVVDDVKQLLMELLALAEGAGPVVAGSAPVLVYVDVLRIVKFLVFAVHDSVDNSGLQVKEK